MASGTIARPIDVSFLHECTALELDMNTSNRMPQFRFVYSNGDRYQISFNGSGDLFLQRKLSTDSSYTTVSRINHDA